jgi:hypothetical protein
MRHHWRWTIFVAGTIATIAALVLLGRSGWNWADWKPATCVATSCFCERARGGSINQPANTWSNLGFVAMGLAILAGIGPGRARGRSPSPIARPAARVYYGFLVASLGWTSMWFHASLTYVGEWFDMFSMILFTSFVIVASIGRATGAGRPALVAGYLVANALFALAMIVHVRFSLPIFIGLTFAILWSDALVRRRVPSSPDRRWLTGAVACCLTSFGIWILDKFGYFSSPFSPFQGHAFWHLGQAGTTGLLFIYHATERAPALAPAPAEVCS